MRVRAMVGVAVTAGVLACAGGSARSPRPSADEAPVVWDLGERGLEPGVDARPVLAELIAQASAALNERPGRSIELRFPEGTWTFDHPSSPAIHIADVPGRLILRGVGIDRTTLVFNQPDQHGLLLEDAHGVTVEGLHLTRPGLYTTQGDVTAVTPGRIRFRVHEGFPDPIPLVQAKDALDNDRTLIRFRGPDDDPELAPNSVSYKLCAHGKPGCGSAMLSVGPGEYEAILEDVALLPDLQVGDRVALKAKAGEQTFRAEACDDLVVRDVRFTRFSAVPLAVKGASNRTIVERVRVERAPAIAGRVPFFAGPGGGPQITAERDGPLIEDCTIVGTTDDGIAVFSHDADSPMRGARIEGNTVRDGQGRGINITQSRDGSCVGNTIVRCQNASIQLKSNQTSEGTDGAVVGWRIEGNRFVQPFTDPTIYLTQENRVARSGRHDDIVIASNVVELASRENPFLHVRNTDDVEVRDTTILSFSDEVDVRGRGLPDAPALTPLVFVEDAARVTGTGNSCTTPTDRPSVATHRKNQGTVDVEWTGTSGPAAGKERRPR